MIVKGISVSSIVPALAENARAGHPQYGSGKERAEELRAGVLPCFTIQFGTAPLKPKSGLNGAPDLTGV